jgi:hypothetical protein
MDPFGVKPAYMPYVLAEWFGHRISIEIIKSVKSNMQEVLQSANSNMQMEVWLFVVKKLVEGKVSV